MERRTGVGRPATLAWLVVLGCLLTLPAFAQARRARATAGIPAGLTVSPQPNTPDASPWTQISLLGVSPKSVSGINVVGSETGRHSGHLRSYSDGSGASFVPRKLFRAGETVTVKFNDRAARGTSHVHYSFRVAHSGGKTILGPPPPSTLNGAQRFVSRPDLRPARVIVTAAAPERAPGFLYVAPLLIPLHKPPMRGEYGPTIIDDRGSAVWFSHAPRGELAMNFRPQIYNGEPVLTWWHGRTTSIGIGTGVDEILSHNYTPIAHVHAGNGYKADLHEFLITRRNTALITVYTPVQANLTSIGGPKHAALLDSIVQEIDIKTGLVEFEWHSVGHISLHEAYAHPHKDRAFDAFHINSIDEGPDGNLLISERHTWTVYNISHRTGAVLWRLGGKHGNFKLARGVRFAWQHDARYQSGGISVFDDEAYPRVRHESRGLVIKLDFRGHKASIGDEFRHHPHLEADSQGNTQVLSNGDTLIGWGAEPFLSEYGQHRQLVFDAHFHGPAQSYRAFRGVWHGTPKDLPAIAARSANGKVTVYASWNGATEVASWRFLAGSNPAALSVVGETARNGFETALTVPQTGPLFAVQALDSNGRVLATSKPIKATK